MRGPEAQWTRRCIHFRWRDDAELKGKTGRLAEGHFQVTGLDRQASGTGVQVRVQVQENPVPEPGADDPNLRPDGWDLRPENELAQTLALSLCCSIIDSVIFPPP
jgi:hypothetical protein